MKKFYTYILILMTLGSSSCSESWLDLDPSTSIQTPEAIRTLEDAQSALNGIYRLASAHSYYGITTCIMEIAGQKMYRPAKAKEPDDVYLLIMNTMYWQVITSTLPWYGIRLTK